MNKNKLIPILIPGLVLIAPAVYAGKDYSDYFAYDVSTVKYVETGQTEPHYSANTQPSQQTIQSIQSIQPTRITEVPTTLPPIPTAAPSGSGYEIYANTPESLAPAPEIQPTVTAELQKPAISHALVAQALASGDLNRLQKLQAQGANLNIAADAQGTTYLHKAAAAGNLALVEFLLSAGVNPNATTDKHWTPLHHAARFGHAAVVQALIAAGADQQQINSDGFRPKQLATNTRQTQTAALLQ